MFERNFDELLASERRYDDEFEDWDEYEDDDDYDEDDDDYEDDEEDE